MRRLALASLTLWTAYALIADARRSSRVVTLVLDAAQARDTAERSSYPLEDFWERARAVGVSGVLLREQSLQDLLDQGSAARFTREEAQRWGAAGLIAPSSPLKADAVWVRDAAVLSRLAEAVRARGLPVSTQAFSGMWALQLPRSVDPRAFPVGVDPEESRRAEEWGLISTRPPIAAVAAENGLAAVRREVVGRGTRRLLFKLEAERGVEANMDALRSVGAALRAAGFSTGPGASERPPVKTDRWARRARILLAFALAAVVPLLAVRQGLHAMRAALAGPHPPAWRVHAFPIFEVASGAAATAAGAAAGGLVAYALLAFAQWRSGPVLPWWDAAATLLPLGLSASALYVLNARALAQRLKSPVTYLGLIRAAALFAAACLLLFPERLGARLRVPEPLWWLSSRWREAFVGLPCLVVGLRMHLDRLRELAASRDGATATDPRPWLLAGLLAPIGTVQAFSQARAPVLDLLAQTAACVVLGAAFGLLLAVFAHLGRCLDGRRRSQAMVGPKS